MPILPDILEVQRAKIRTFFIEVFKIGSEPH
jgi:hypothetical protein